jgi:hypothetical protein
LPLPVLLSRLLCDAAVPRKFPPRERLNAHKTEEQSQEWLCHGPRGLDEFGVGANFDVGILQGGEGEAIVTKFLKVPFHISLLAQGSTGETKKQLYGRMGMRKIGTGEVQH